MLLFDKKGDKVDYPWLAAKILLVLFIAYQFFNFALGAAKVASPQEQGAAMGEARNYVDASRAGNCASFASKEQVDRCYMTSAIMNENISICQKIEEGDTRLLCEEYVKKVIAAKNQS
jgi:hypothetical protein